MNSMLAKKKKNVIVDARKFLRCIHEYVCDLGSLKPRAVHVNIWESQTEVNSVEEREVGWVLVKVENR